MPHGVARSKNALFAGSYRFRARAYLRIVKQQPQMGWRHCIGPAAAANRLRLISSSPAASGPSTAATPSGTTAAASPTTATAPANPDD